MRFTECSPEVAETNSIDGKSVKCRIRCASTICPLFGTAEVTVATPDGKLTPGNERTVQIKTTVACRAARRIERN